MSEDMVKISVYELPELLRGIPGTAMAGDHLEVLRMAADYIDKLEERVVDLEMSLEAIVDQLE